MNLSTDLNINRAEPAFLRDLPTRNTAERDTDTGFQDVLRDLVGQVNTLQKSADASINGLVTGATTNVHDVTIKMAEAGVAFDLMMQVRNKLLEAYQQIIKMQA
jgi:flagellar hook-basal body complex protein FliE